MPKRKITGAAAVTQVDAEATAFGNLTAQFKSTDGETTGPPLNLPADATPEQLQLLINELLGSVRMWRNLIKSFFLFEEC